MATLLQLPVVILALGALAMAGTCRAQQTAGSVFFVPAKSQSAKIGRVSDDAHVLISGPIGPDSPRQLQAALKAAKASPAGHSWGGQPIIRVFLDSPGGEVPSAIAMGRMIRALAAETWVDLNATCASACILVLAGGVDRTAVPTSRLALHRPFFDSRYFSGLSFSDAQARYATLSASVQKHLAAMGVPDDVYRLMLAIPSHEVLVISSEEAEAIGLLGKDPAHAEWERARATQRHGVKHVKSIDALIACINSGQPVRDCSRLHRQ